MKPQLKHPTNKDFCLCGEKINEMYLEISQNRWATPKICLKCLKEYVKKIEEGKEIDEIRKREIIYKPQTINKNSWMSA